MATAACQSLTRARWNMSPTMDIFASMRQEKSFPAACCWNTGGRRQLWALPVYIREAHGGSVTCCWVANYTLCNFHPPSQTRGKWWYVLRNYTQVKNIYNVKTRCFLVMHHNAPIMTCTELSVGLFLMWFTITQDFLKQNTSWHTVEETVRMYNCTADFTESSTTEAALHFLANFYLGPPTYNLNSFQFLSLY